MCGYNVSEVSVVCACLQNELVSMVLYGMISSLLFTVASC